ncbi:Os06g0568500 [Oryza sativa Japonica Group]|nr:hypothetical protein OsI_23419 [Oryza sativa Indica Group]EAZ37406.1 hypothetical protein OsJ_21743 [Oryza sativa Japonica Group]BAS98301.1 Os06g0568500 [Oryza sativa Japonica Group]
MAHGRVVRLVRHGAARLEVNMLSRRTYSSGPEYSRPCRLTNAVNCAPGSSLGGYPSITYRMMPPPLPDALEPPTTTTMMRRTSRATAMVWERFMARYE